MNYRYLKSKSFYLPTISFFIFLLTFIILFQTGSMKYYSFERTLTQWDGQHYLSIARDGYFTEPCSFGKQFICGNVGWFPFYPIVGYLLSWLPIPINMLMILISWLSLWIALLILYNMATTTYSEKTALASIIALLVFPSSFYFLTVFPYSIYLLIVISIFYLLQKELFIPVILLTAFLAVTYPSGIVIGLPLLYYLIRDWKKYSSGKKLQLVAAMFSIGIALTLYCTYYYFKFDDFFLYNRFQSQPYYAHQPTFPLIPIYRGIMTFLYSHPVWITLVFTIGVVIVFYRKKIDVGMQLFMFGILLFTPTAGTTDCYYRHIIVAFPLYFMIGSAVESKRKYLLIPYLLLSIYLMLTVFLPDFKIGKLM